MQRASLICAASAALIIWFSWALLPIAAPAIGWPWKPEMLGQWGDAFGALNALFSALAFVAVLLTLTQQQKQIDEAATDQHLQRFERTFYELLRLLREARYDVEYMYSKEYEGGTRKKEANYADRVCGSEAFKRAQFEIKYWVDVQLAANGKPSSKAVAAVYDRIVHERYESSFAPYYRLLYTLLLRIKSDKKLKPEEKERYGNLLRSQLTSHEVALCCYNGLSAISGSFKDLLSEFRIAKYLPNDFGREILQNYYPSTMFLGRDVVTTK